jgi:hypothetical protein
VSEGPEPATLAHARGSALRWRVPSPAGDARLQLPPDLERLDDLRIDVGRRRGVPLVRCRVAFDFCSKPVPVGQDPAWAAKPQVLLDGRALFPEIALLMLFQKAGWKGVWFDPVHRRGYDKMPNVSKGAGLDTRVASVLAKVNAAAPAGRRASCWDLVLWDGRSVLFVDVAPGPASPGHARIAWLDAAYRTGLSPGQFLVVEWETRKVVPRKKMKGSPAR